MLLVLSRVRTVVVFVLLLLFGSGVADAQEVVTYSVPSDAPEAEDFTVEVEGQDVFVHDTPVAAVARFDFEDGPVEVTIWPNDVDVKWVDIRPEHLGIQPRLEDGLIRFTLQEPRNLSIEINRNLERPLFLFAGAPAMDKPDPSDPDVRYFDGGQTHEPGLVHLESGETVYVEGGAVVKGAFRAEDATDITIRGHGVIDASAAGRLEEQFPDEARVVSCVRCRDLTVRGVTLLRGTMWQIVPDRSQNVRIAGVRVVSRDGGDDPLNPLQSRNVVIDGVFLRSKDDCMAIKTPDPNGPGARNVVLENSTLWSGAWGNAIEIGFELREDVEDVRYENIDITHVEHGAAISIHNGDAGTVQDVHYQDVRIEDAREKLFDLAIFRSWWSLDKPEGEIRGDNFWRHYLHGTWDNVMKYDPEREDYHAQFRGHIRDVTVRNVRLMGGPLPFSVFAGFDEEHAVEDVTIDGLFWTGERIDDPAEGHFYLEHVRDLRFANEKGTYSLDAETDYSLQE